MRRRNLFSFLVAPAAVIGGTVAYVKRANAEPIPGPDIRLVNKEITLTIMPGRDGHLWIKPNSKGEWLRVVTE